MLAMARALLMAPAVLLVDEREHGAPLRSAVRDLFAILRRRLVRAGVAVLCWWSKTPAWALELRASALSAGARAIVASAPAAELRMTTCPSRLPRQMAI